MNPNHTSPFGPNSTAYGNPGSALPGSQLQLSSSGPRGQQSLQSTTAYGGPGFNLFGSQSQLPSCKLQGQQPLQSNLGFKNDFDVAFDEFDKMLQELDSTKRPSAGQVQSGTNLPLQKRQTLEGQQPGSMPAMLDMNVASMPMIPSNNTWPNQVPSTSAPLLPQFSPDTGQVANHSMFDSVFLNQSSSANVLPSGLTQYQQTPSPPQNLAGAGTSNDILQSRLQAAHQKIGLLTEKCNQYEKDLGKYTTPDPKTGKMPMQLLEDKLTTFRRVCAIYDAQLKQYKETLKKNGVAYYHLASQYRKLAESFRRQQAFLSPDTLPATPRSLSTDTSTDSSNHLGKQASVLTSTGFLGVRSGDLSGYSPTSSSTAPTPAASNTSASITPATGPAAAPVNGPADATTTVPVNDSAASPAHGPVNAPADGPVACSTATPVTCPVASTAAIPTTVHVNGPVGSAAAPSAADTASSTKKHSFCTPDEIFETDPTKYTITDEELARLLEEELARTDEPATNDGGLDYLFEE